MDRANWQAASGLNAWPRAALTPGRRNETVGYSWEALPNRAPWRRTPDQRAW